MTETKLEAIRKAQAEAEAAKSRLIDIENELREADANREANALASIICRLEAWQNR